MGNELIVSYADMEKMANDLVASRFFGVKNVEECMALMLIAQAEGLHPAVAVRDYHVIQGKPSLKADAMLARFQQQGGVVEWVEVTDKRVAAKFSHPKSSPTPTLIEWDDARVIQAQLGGNQMHKKYPRQMKRARVISEGVRTVYPACTNGLYVPEEVADILPPSAGAHAAVVEEPPPVVKPPMREVETQRVIDPPTEPEAKTQDDKINGSPLPVDAKPVPPKEVATPDFDKTMIICGKDGKDWTKKFLKDMNEQELQFAYDHTQKTKRAAKGKVLDAITTVQKWVEEVADARGVQLTAF